MNLQSQNWFVKMSDIDNLIEFQLERLHLQLLLSNMKWVTLL